MDSLRGKWEVKMRQCHPFLKCIYYFFNLVMLLWLLRWSWVRDAFWVRRFSGLVVVQDASRRLVQTQKYTKAVKDCQYNDPGGEKKQTEQPECDLTQHDSVAIVQILVLLLVPLLFASLVSSLFVRKLWPKFQNARLLKGQVFSEGMCIFLEHFAMWSLSVVLLFFQTINYGWRSFFTYFFLFTAMTLSWC